MTTLLGLVAVLFVLWSLQARARLQRLAVLAESGEPVRAEHRFVTAPGVVLDGATRRAASAYAHAEGLELVDLVPGDLPALEALGALALVDPEAYRRDALSRGFSSGHALLVSADVLERARQQDARPADAVELVRLALSLRKYAATRSGLAVAPSLSAVALDPSRRKALLHALLGEPYRLVLGVQAALWLLVLAGLLGMNAWAFVALICVHAQVPLAFSGMRLEPRDLARALLLRFPLELWILARTLLGPPPATIPPDMDARRAEYARLVAGGVERFFEPRRTTCPTCASAELELVLATRDWFQHKPGRFVLERCRACGMVFQNPRLSVAGLDFYYKDFYDGLGEESLEVLFAYDQAGYEARARSLEGHARPTRWLDVGGGHGHFCLIAAGVFPDAEFEVLDLADSALEAKRRGWVADAWRGFFPDLAPRLAGRYDVVSMNHYLEHTREPELEIAAARKALAPGGHLLIELPDPESPFGRWLGWAWLPWFQPQHQNLLPLAGLERLLAKHGFEPVVTQRTQAHQKADLTWAVLMLLLRLAPPPDRPWLAPTTRGERLVRDVAWLAALPLLFAALVLDRVIALFVERARAWNTYRVLARRSA